MVDIINSFDYFIDYEDNIKSGAISPYIVFYKNEYEKYISNMKKLLGNNCPMILCINYEESKLLIKEFDINMNGILLCVLKFTDGKLKYKNYIQSEYDYNIFLMFI